MLRRYSCLSGFVLAGGDSRRMGRPKPQLPLGGETMLERQVRILRSVCRSVVVVGLPSDSPNLDVAALADQIPGRGPLGGIHTALLHARTEFNLLFGCDLPFVSARFLAFLARRAVERHEDVTVPESPDFGVQPVCAVYRRSALPVVRASLNAHLNRSQELIFRLRVYVIPWREIARAGYPRRIFANINTAEDYEAALGRLKAEG